MVRRLMGIDIGGTKSAAIVGDSQGRVIGRVQMATGGPDQTLAALGRAAVDLQKECGGVSACGIACGGPLRTDEGLILSPPNLPGWDRVPVVRHFAEALGVATALENDANAAAVAEWRWGLGQRVNDLVYLTCGTGQGAGIIAGGRLLRGCGGLAGEIGHVRLLPLGPVGYRKAGSVEGLTSGTGLALLARLRLGERHEPSLLDECDPTALSGQTVGEAALQGDALAVGLIAEVGEYLGRASAILIDVLNPRRISLGSMAHRLGDLLLEPVRQAARREALPEAFAACDIDRSILGDRIQDLAALAVAPT